VTPRAAWANDFDSEGILNFTFRLAAPEHETTARVDSALLERARAEQAALQELWENTPARLLEQAGAPDLNALLRHLARRRFPSPRPKAGPQERLEPDQ